jgi:hypothetical protein
MNNRDYTGMSSEELVLLGYSELRKLEAQILDTLEHIEECDANEVSECNELIEELNDLYERINAALEIDYI